MFSAHRHLADAAGPQPLGRDIGEAGGDRAPRREAGRSTVRCRSASGRARRPRPDEQRPDLGKAGADQAREAQDFPGAGNDDAGTPGPRSPRTSTERRRPGAAGRGRRRRRSSCPTIIRTRPSVRPVTPCRHPAVPQHGDPIGDAEHLFQVMGDEQHAEAAAFTRWITANSRSTPASPSPAVGSSRTSRPPCRPVGATARASRRPRARSRAAAAARAAAAPPAPSGRTIAEFGEQRGHRARLRPPGDRARRRRRTHRCAGSR